MKKIIITILILFAVIFNINTKAFTAKKIDLKIKDDETNIVFLRLKNSKSLLITDEEDSNLFIIDYKNDKDLKQAIKIFNTTPNIFYINKNIDKRIDNIHIFKQKSTLKFRINNYTLCINSNQNLNNCDFVYLTTQTEDFKVNENLSAIFYDDDIDQKYLKSARESWIEKAIVSTDSFTILKLNEDSYNILVVPSTNR